MLGWKQRYIPLAKPPLLPFCLQSVWWKSDNKDPIFSSPAMPFLWSAKNIRKKLVCFTPILLCFILSYSISLIVRLLEMPFWYNPEYMFNGEHLLATHDAYHWLAGAEGFEFGADHPMALFLSGVSFILNATPANVAFWLPPFISSLVAIAMCLWAWGLGRPFSGLCAGVLVSLSPAFFARTQLGFYDNDFFVLLFVMLIGFVPALWLHPWLKTLPDFCGDCIMAWKNKRILVAHSPKALRENTDSAWVSFLERCAKILKRNSFISLASITEMEEAMLSWQWLLALILAGCFGHWTQSWHSFFPYYIRFSALVMPVLILVCGPLQGRSILLRGALCHAFPLLLGIPGLFLSLLLAMLFHLSRFDSLSQLPMKILPAYIRSQLEKNEELVSRILLFSRRLLLDYRFLGAIWGIIVLLCFDLSIVKLMRDSFIAYTNRGGDIASHAGSVDPLIFPSVSESIIETQTVSFNEFLEYFYPSYFIVGISLLAVVAMLCIFPVFVWFVPMLGLFFLSHQMGARMTMFGSPPLALSFCLLGGWIFERGVERLSHLEIPQSFSATTIKNIWSFFYAPLSHQYIKLLWAVLCALYLAWPLIMTIPYQSSNGPIISKEQAAALDFIKSHTPKSSIVWNWWDWGYATHHFARRSTIADGARHGGPSLYLPAAVYTTTDPRFARQIIKYTALKNNNPGNVFEGLTASGAQDLMVELSDKSKPLITAPGKQYLVVSYDIVTIGAWISTYGSWNFNRKEMHPSLLSSISQGSINFNSDTGLILYNTEKERHSVQAGSVSIFSPQKLERYIYQPRGDTIPPYNRHFIFDIKNRYVDVPENLKKTWSYRFWNMRLGEINLYSAVSNKLLMDSVFYNTMMVQLLVSSKNDLRITPYFKCVFDNTYCRVYEVL